MNNIDKMNRANAVLSPLKITITNEIIDKIVSIIFFFKGSLLK